MAEFDQNNSFGKLPTNTLWLFLNIYIITMTSDHLYKTLLGIYFGFPCGPTGNASPKTKLARQGSNLQPPDPESGVLPIELRANEAAP